MLLFGDHPILISSWKEAPKLTFLEFSNWVLQDLIYHLQKWHKMVFGSDKNERYLWWEQMYFISTWIRHLCLIQVEIECMLSHQLNQIVINSICMFTNMLWIHQFVHLYNLLLSDSWVWHTNPFTHWIGSGVSLKGYSVATDAAGTD